MTKSDPVTQDFLDSSQYQNESIQRYESVYGEDFVSPGGRAVAREMITRMALKPGSRVLDVGCGLGGSAFVMASEFGLRVEGIDLSKNMLALAQQKLEAHGLANEVSLAWGDCLKMDCPECYDGIYSRDVFLHIDDKPRLFAVLHDSLRAGGRLLFTDYCSGNGPWDDDFSTYVRQRGYSLRRVDEYASLIARAGFDEVEAEDISAYFVDILESDIERIESLEIGRKARNGLLRSWRQKLARSQAGHHRWGLFSAKKPETSEPEG